MLNQLNLIFFFLPYGLASFVKAYFNVFPAHVYPLLPPEALGDRAILLRAVQQTNLT